MNKNDDKNTDDKSDIIHCDVCGKDFDAKHLDQVMAHMVHRPLKMTGVIGRRLTPEEVKEANADKARHEAEIAKKSGKRRLELVKGAKKSGKEG
jgi:hypothetical protein